MSPLTAVRAATGKRRPGHDHGCKPVEVIPGLWTAHFHDIETRDALKAVSGAIKTVINTATDKCKTTSGSYGADIDVIRVEGLLDDPNAIKEVDAMCEGAEQDKARAALPKFPEEECAGDARKDFERVNAAIEAAQKNGGSAMVHCYASISRSAAFILAYIMKTKRVSLVEAVKLMRKTWDATWPNDTFVKQLLEYEAELGLAGTPGVVEMKVTSKKSAGFYCSAAKSFLTEGEDKDGNKRPAACVLKMSALGDAISSAVAAANAVQAAGLGKINKVETSYPAMDGGAHGSARPYYYLRN
eukprot:TRINITY_DN13931_c0_g1_i1.p2 TRINITY_DN13931_c0_g1~~TRINITY_DN13931_c0_g1_i1.p2  ORF type:complete len:300 (-),score=79.59 TRINITY_DN13931_c0_g1_i1:940-1839(-)